MLVVLRFLILIPLGFVAACLAGAFALVWPFLGPLPALGEDPVYWIQAATGFALQAMQIGSIAFLPWAAFMIASEILRIRSAIVHGAAGLLGAFAVLRIAYGGAQPGPGIQTALVVAGLAFALVYWLVAGHGAGRWRRRAPATIRGETAL